MVAVAAVPRVAQATEQEQGQWVGRERRRKESLVGSFGQQREESNLAGGVGNMEPGKCSAASVGIIDCQHVLQRAGVNTPPRPASAPWDDHAPRQREAV